MLNRSGQAHVAVGAGDDRGNVAVMTPPDVILVPSPILPPATWEPVRAGLGPPPARIVVLPIDPGESIWR